MKVETENAITPLKEKNAKITGSIIDGIIIENLPKEVEIDEIKRIINDTKTQEDAGHNINLNDADIEIVDTKKNKVNVVIKLENEVAWKLLTLLRGGKVRTTPYIIGSNMMRRRLESLLVKSEDSEESNNEEEFHDTTTEAMDMHEDEEVANKTSDLTLPEPECITDYEDKNELDNKDQIGYDMENEVTKTAEVNVSNDEEDVNLDENLPIANYNSP